MQQNNSKKYSDDFKKTIVTLYQSAKTYTDIRKEYGVSSSILANLVRKYSQVQVDDDMVLTAQQIKALQHHNAEFDEENLILNKPLQYSRHTKTETRNRPTAFKQHSISVLGRVLNVNRSTYHKFLNRKPSGR